ncbi:MAG: peptide ABC transporter substrate-binding protein [Candidatus Dormibacteria bacterium]
MAAIAAGLALTLTVLGGAYYLFHLTTTRVVASFGGTYSEALVGMPDFMNPLLAGNDTANDLDALIFQGLTHTNSDDTIQPVLAQSWDTTDGQSWVFHLRHGVKWADGKPFTADDVVFTIQVIQNPSYSDPLLSASWKPVSVTKVDDFTVKFDLKAPSGTFLVNTSLGIIPKHVFSNASTDQVYASPFNSKPFGTGPFQLAARDRSSLTLEPNPNFPTRPYLARMVFKVYRTSDDAVDALRRAEVDAFAGLSPQQVQSVSQLAGIQLVKAQTFQYVDLLFNQRDEVPYFQDVKVRQAVAQAVDRNAVRAVLLGQTVAVDGPLPPSVFAYRKDVPKFNFDAARARALLDSAGWTLPKGAKVRQKDGKPLSVTLVSSDAYPYKQVADVITGDLVAVGFQVRATAVPTPRLVAQYLTPRTFMLAVTAWDNGPDPDLFSVWHSTQTGPDGYNFSAMKKDLIVDQDLELGQKSINRDERLGHYLEMQLELVNQIPAVWLYEPTFTFAVNSRVQGIRMDPAIESADRYNSVANWYVETHRVSKK